MIHYSSPSMAAMSDYFAAPERGVNEDMEAGHPTQPVSDCRSIFLTGTALAQSKSAPFKPAIPKTWDEKALADWATPVAGLNVRPGHFSEEEYYRAPLNNYRTYPVYAPGREPAGYWDMLQKVGPKPLIEPAMLKTEEDWIEAGRQVFEELDHFTQRIYDPDLIAILRSPENLGSTSSRFNHARFGGCQQRKALLLGGPIAAPVTLAMDRTANDSMAPPF